jgi:hypothetical protein
MKLPIKSFASILLCFIVLEGCFLFPTNPDGVSQFSPTLDWVAPASGVVMDITSVEDIVIGGNTMESGTLHSIREAFDKQGQRLYSSSVEDSGIVRDIIASA